MTLLALVLFSLQAPPNHSETDCAAALSRFHAAFKGASETAQVAAVTDLGKHLCDKTVEILRHLLVEDTEKVRIAAAKAIGKADSGKAVLAVVEAIAANDKEPTVLEALAQALKELDREAGAEALNPYLKDHERYVIDALHVIVPALGSIGSASSVDPLIDLLRHAEEEAHAKNGGKVPNVKGVKGTGRRLNDKESQRLAQLKGPIEKALQEITGHAPESSAQKWEDWWKANRTTLQAAAKVVYRCPATGKRWEELVGVAVHCPYHEGAEKDISIIKVKLH